MKLRGVSCGLSDLGLRDGQRVVMVIGTRSIKSTEGKLVEWEVPAGQPGDGRGPWEASGSPHPY